MGNSTRRLAVNVLGSDGKVHPAGTYADDMLPDVAEAIGEHAWTSDDAPAGGEGESAATNLPAVQAPVIEEHITLTEPAPPAPVPAVERDAREGAVEVPPMSGPGSGVEAWRSYAAAHGVGDFPEHVKRAEIVEALEVAGIPVTN